MSAATLPIHDTDGVPPGIDLSLQGQVKTITFKGQFYATPDVPYSEFSRQVEIIFASAEVYIALDLTSGNFYVVDREKELSLDCRMKAMLTDPVEHRNIKGMASFKP